MKNILYKQSLDYNDINNKNIIFCLHLWKFKTPTLSKLYFN